MDLIEAANAALAKRANIWNQRTALLEDKVKSDAEKRAAYELMDVEMKALKDEAESHVRAAEAEAEARALNTRAAQLTAGGGPRPAADARDLAQELREVALGKRSEVVVDLRSAFVDGNGGPELRTATSGTATNAGNTKATLFAAEVIEAMRFRSDFFNMARTMTTSSGEVMEWPVKNAVNPATAPVQGTVGIVAENTSIPKADQSWTKTNLGAYKYGIIVEATAEIVTDSELPILSILAADAGETLADAIMTDLMIGNGTGKPWGWVTRASGGVNAANLAGVTFDNLIDLQYSLVKPYRRNASWVFADLAIPALRKLKDTQGRYIWEPSTQAGVPDLLLGKPFATDPNLATSGAGAKIGVYGDAKKYLIRQVKDLRIVRSDEYGFDRDVVAFKVTWRGTGDLFDLNSVKALTVTA